ncbi:unnamed protein product [Brassica oleracea var. botrytis]|uniref:(rape) hypothetical protein n=1 Tax=Brassica napus TaxID=3708 RepID=A0A816KQ52_BRANA|nr:unnamed protein product [Brassica napus]
MEKGVGLRLKEEDEVGFYLVFLWFSFFYEVNFMYFQILYGVVFHFLSFRFYVFEDSLWCSLGVCFFT